MGENDIYWVYVGIWFICGYITAQIAQRKGYRYYRWMIYGFLCFPVAIIYLAMNKPSYDNGLFVECPYCHEAISYKASVCNHCNKDISPK